MKLIRYTHLKLLGMGFDRMEDTAHTTMRDAWRIAYRHARKELARMRGQSVYMTTAFVGPEATAGEGRFRIDFWYAGRRWPLAVVACD